MYEANRYIDLTEKKWFRTGIIIRKFLCRNDADWEMELYEPAPEEVEAGLNKVEERIRDFYK